MFQCYVLSIMLHFTRIVKQNLTYAKTFTVCLDWENDDIVLHLLNTVFGSLT